jgi:(4-(4-[2-(gamma-L-glutamylamino)ethyl]phenoxymethyl)furan-2-yl)methanamine synthase
VMQLPCPLWQGLDRLHAALDDALPRLGCDGDHAITMTGEMVDLFESRGEGVRRLVDTLGRRLGGGTRRLFYAGAAGFVDAARAAADPLSIASANWHATAALLARRLPSALLLDIGSTTTDVAVIAGGALRTRGCGDAERLGLEELVYSGVVRTPVMALAQRAPFGGAWTPLMAEHFATTADVYRLTGQLPEGADQHPAADGGEKTVDGSVRRLARMIGHDARSAGLADWRRLANWLAQAQLARIEQACHRALSRGLLEEDAPVVGAGIGRFLAVRLAQRLARPYRDFADLVAAAPGYAERVAACAPAVAVACLLRDLAALEAG